MAALALVLTGAVTVGRSIERETPGREVAMALPSPETARATSLGFDTVLADLYFLRAVQYYGNPRSYGDNYKHLGPLLSLVAALDTRFREPLLWGGIAIQRNLGRDTWINIPESTRLLRLGVERFPEDWRFYMYLAYNLSTFQNRHEEAARVLEEGSRLENAPDYLAALATRTWAQAGDLDTAAAFAEALASTAEDPAVREKMQARLVDIRTERRLRALDAAAERYRDRTGAWPTAPEQLVEAGVLPRLPEEPRGGRWRFAPEDHRAQSSEMWGRLELYEAMADPASGTADELPAADGHETRESQPRSQQ